MSYGDDDWFSYTQDNEFNRPSGSPGAAGNYYEPGNIDNIPLAEEPTASPTGLDFEFSGANEEYGYDPLGLTPSEGIHGQHQQPGTSNDGGGQFQNMHIMQGNDPYDQHMHPPTTVAYNSFEMPTVISGNHDSGPYQDLGIVDPNSYYSTQQPSTSQGNGMIVSDSYEVMEPSTSYAPQMDHVNSLSVGNPQSQSGMNQQLQGMNDDQPQPPPKPKPKKKAPPKKKPPAPAENTVGNVLTTATKLSQRENNNENGAEKVETRVSAEDMMTIGALMQEIESLKQDEARGYDHKAQIAKLEAEIVQVFSKNLTNTTSGDSIIMNQMKSVANTAPSVSTLSHQQQQQQPPLPTKKAPPKKSRSQAPKNVQQQQQRQAQQQSQPVLIAQAQMTSTKIIMEPPTTTMVPSSNQLSNMYNDSSADNYGSYPSMDEPGTSQQYNDYQQPQSHESMQQQHHQSQIPPQVIHAKVVPTMSQRTHNYRQAVIFTSQTNNEPGPSPQFHQPLSHESHSVDQIQDQQQYHPQNHQRPQSQQMYVSSQHQQEGQMYQQDDEPTLGDVVRQRYQGSLDAPHLRQQLISSVNVNTNKQTVPLSGAPTSSPGNYQTNNLHQQQYSEPYHHHGSYPASHDMQPNSHSQGYEVQCETSNDFYEGPTQRPGSQIVSVQQESHQHHQYDQREMYVSEENQQEMMEPESEPEIEYPAPEASEALSRDQLLERLAQKSKVREAAVNTILAEQRSKLEDPDLTPFRSKVDILERMLPYHYYSVGEEPVADFESTYLKTMTDATSRADALGRRIRSIVLRDTMRSTEWERNMILFMETESERRKLEEDRKLAEQDPHAFLQGSEIIQAVKCNRLNLELVKRSAPEMPAHLKDLKLPDGVLSAVYKEFEFDSYDENRPRGSLLPFINEEPEWESEFESEPEPESEQEEEQVPQSDHSLIEDSTQISSVPSATRLRKESESTLGWRDGDDTPLVSPESVKFGKVSGQLSNQAFANKAEFNKPERFPFGRISDATRKNEQSLIQQPHASESLGSSDESTSSEGTPQPPQHQTTETPPPEHISCSSSLLSQESSIFPSTSGSSSFTPAHKRRRISSDEGSPEIGDDFSMSPPETVVPVEEIPPIPLPVPVHMIKKEKDDSSKLKLRVPVAILQKGIKMAVDGDDKESRSASEKRIPLKKKFNWKDIKLEEPSPDREGSTQSSKNATSISPSSRAKTSDLVASEQMARSKPSVKSSVLKTPMQTPSKTKHSESRKRKRSEKIDETPQQKKTTREISNSFVTPKNGVILKEGGESGRFLKTMTDGRKLVMKVGKIPNNINHFVTPRRDSKGNMHKDLTVTENTRLKMRWFKTNGHVAVKITEHSSEKTPQPKLNHPSITDSIVPTPSIPSVSVKARPAPASRKGSVDIGGKDKKANSVKSKNTFCNRFNPFANASKPKPPTNSTTTIASSTGSMNITTTAGSSASSAPPQQRTPSVPTSLTQPRRIEPKIIPTSNTSLQTSLIKTTPIVPKITVTNVPAASGQTIKTEQASEMNKKPNSLLPWLFESSAKPKSVKPQASSVSSFISSIFPTTNLLHVATEPTEAIAVTAQESPRANSSLSFFDDEKGNGFPFLRSPKRTNEPLPVVEFSDDDEDDLAHSTFSHATDHLLQASKLNKQVNGTTPILPWSNNP